MSNPSTMEEYLKEQEELGYIDSNGYPLKCQYCGSTDFKQVNIMACQYGSEEYDVKCNSCDKIIAQWKYGYWQV